LWIFHYKLWNSIKLWNDLCIDKTNYYFDELIMIINISFHQKPQLLLINLLTISKALAGWSPGTICPALLTSTNVKFWYYFTSPYNVPLGAYHNLLGAYLNPLWPSHVISLIQSKAPAVFTIISSCPL